MSYIPELRQSLVKAAAGQASGRGPAKAPDPAKGGRARSLAGLGFALASILAIAVAGAAVLLVGHRGASPSSGNAPSREDAGHAAASAAARRLLAEFVPPRGAVAVSGDPSSPRRLGYPNDGLPDPTAVDLTRFWIVPGGIQAVLKEIRREESSRGYWDSGMMTEGPAPAPGHPLVVELGSDTFPLTPSGSVNRELQVSVARARGAGTALRMDAQAWWVAPRAAGMLVPPMTRDIALMSTTPGPVSTTSPGTIASEPAVGQVVHFINSLPLAPQRSRVTCQATRPSVRLWFEVGGPSALHGPTEATVFPTCGLVVLAVPGRVRATLAWKGAVPRPSAGEIALFLRLLAQGVRALEPPPGSHYASASSRASH